MLCHLRQLLALNMKTHPDSMCAVYVLSDGADKLYVGQTYKLDQRMEQHTARQCQSTAAYATHSVVHYFLVGSRYAALKLEAYLQHIQRKEGNSSLLDIVMDCPHLSVAIWKDALVRKDTPYQLQYKPT